MTWQWITPYPAAVRVSSQTSTDGEKIEIVEGINLKVKDVWTYNYNGTHMNGVDKIYIGDGTEWKLFKTNS